MTLPFIVAPFLVLQVVTVTILALLANFPFAAERESLRSWFNTVELACRGYTLGGAVPMLWAGYMWAGYNETCLKDSSGQYCNDVISKFTSVSDYTKMPREEMCSTCYVKRLAMMQASPYSIYDDYYERQLQYIYTKCGLKGNTTVPNSLTPVLEDNSLDCGTDEWYTTSTGETCDSIGLKRGVSSASLFIVNQYSLPSCSADAVIEPGTKLCMPQSATVFISCELRRIANYLSLMRPTNCLRGMYNFITRGTDTTTPQPFNPYTYDKIAPPTGAKVPQGTTERCGRWYVAGKEDSCAHICAVSSIDIDLLFMVNTGLGTDAAACSAKLVAGNAYCVGPNHDWKDHYPQRTSVSTTIYITDGYVWPAETGE
ncbi:hypothetical protein FG05_08160 [Fusarium graminearum]|nr:hypothetical protein FG05_08160 [Fusarium graminearum]